MPSKNLFLTILIALGVTGCSSQVLYESAQSYQREQCYKVDDLQARKACMEKSKVPYEDYKRQTEALQSSR